MVRFSDHFIKHERLILFFLMVYLINPFGYGNYSFFLLFSLLLFDKLLGKYLDKNSLILLAFSLTYVAIIYQYQGVYNVGNSNMIVYLIAPIMMYEVGKFFQNKYCNGNSFYKITFIILIMFSFIAFVSIALDIYQVGFKGSRNIILLNYDSSVKKSATLINSMISPFLALFGTLFIPAKLMERDYKKVYLLFSIIALLFSIRLGSRTGLIIFILSFILNYLFFIRFISTKKKVICTVLFLILSFVAFNVSIKGNSDLFYSYQDRLESDEYGSTTAGGRTKLWSVGIENLVKYPMGAVVYDRDLSYSHNFWLDIGRVAGVIPMFFMLVFCIKMLYVLYKLVKIRSISLYKRSVFLSLNIAFLSIFLVEPILEAYFAFLSVYFFFSGLMYAMYKQSKKNA